MQLARFKKKSMVVSHTLIKKSEQLVSKIHFVQRLSSQQFILNSGNIPIFNQKKNGKAVNERVDYTTFICSKRNLYEKSILKSSRLIISKR